MSLKSQFLAPRFFLALSLLVVCGCEPRGETKTLQQVLELARNAFEQAKGGSVALDPEISGVVSKLTSNFEILLTSTDMSAVQAKCGEIADALAQVVTRAGFTARPAFGELINEFRTLGSAAPNGGTADFAANNRAPLRLLVARTYRLLASELAATRFQVS